MNDTTGSAELERIHESVQKRAPVTDDGALLHFRIQNQHGQTGQKKEQRIIYDKEFAKETSGA